VHPAMRRQALFTTYKFQYPLMVALLQMAIIAPFCYAVARPKLEWEMAKSVAPLAMVNVLNVVAGLIGRALNTPPPQWPSSLRS
jgi:hypothetical protein